MDSSVANLVSCLDKGGADIFLETREWMELTQAECFAPVRYMTLFNSKDERTRMALYNSAVLEIAAMATVFAAYTARKMS